jgi:hypothetical protein
LERSRDTEGQLSQTVSNLIKMLKERFITFWQVWKLGNKRSRIDITGSCTLETKDYFDYVASVDGPR